MTLKKVFVEAYLYNPSHGYCDDTFHRDTGSDPSSGFFWKSTLSLFGKAYLRQDVDTSSESYVRGSLTTHIHTLNIVPGSRLRTILGHTGAAPFGYFTRQVFSGEMQEQEVDYLVVRLARPLYVIKVGGGNVNN